MRYVFAFPDIGEGISEGKLFEWYVQKGHAVKTGTPLVRIETDKVVTDIPSPKEGTVVAVFGKPGETIRVGDPLVELDIHDVSGKDAQDIAHEKPIVKTEEPVGEKSFGVVGTIEVAGNAAYLPPSEEGLARRNQEEKSAKKKALATPVARVMAKELGVDIDLVQGTGPAGRVTKADIQAFREKSRNAQAGAEVSHMLEEPRLVFEPLSTVRKAIARNMTVSKQNAVHMTVHDEVEISPLIAVRERFKASYAERGIKLTYLAFIVKATALALKQHRALNAEIDIPNSRMVYKNYVNIGIAVDTEAGLLVPVIRGADSLSIRSIAEAIESLSAKAKERKLSQDDMKDGTFTITNYGAVGGIFAVPVINFPQAAILGVGRIQKKPVVAGDSIAVGNVLPLSLSVDHRIVDGAEATRFLNEVQGYIADPVSLFMEMA